MAANIHVIEFEDFFGAENMLENVNTWEEKGWIKVEDAVVVTLGEGTDRPNAAYAMPSPETPMVVPGHMGSAELEIKQTVKRGGKFALGGGGLGLLAGMLLGGPVGGLVVGATLGAITGAMRDTGIDDKFIKEVSAGMRPGTSALFLMTSGGDDAKIIPEVRGHQGRIVKTTLSDERERALRNALEKGK
jgi:uncharacterized membrane protein